LWHRAARTRPSQNEKRRRHFATTPLISSCAPRCFLDDGRIELDTNVVERSIRPIVLNRKNALFAGHAQGAENWACIASLIETCKLHGVDPQTYFTDVLTKLVNLWPASRLDELMPWTWATERSTNKLAA
jgi:transposase